MYCVCVYCLCASPFILTGVTDLSVGVDVKGVEADNIVITGITISNNSDHLYWNNIQKVQGKQPCINNSD